MGRMTMRDWRRTCHTPWSTLAVILVALSSTGCTMVGPDYVRPPVPTAADWIETNEPAVKREPAQVSAWWTVSQDPVLNTLVETPTYRIPPSGPQACACSTPRPRGESPWASFFRNDRTHSAPTAAMTSARIRQTVTRLASRPRL